MRKYILTICLFVIGMMALHAQDRFPDGTIVPEWFKDDKPTDIGSLGKQFVITEHGVKNDSTVVQTRNIQAFIDEAHINGGGVVVVPPGVYLSGSLFFKQGTHLHLQEGAVLKGSDDISDFEVLDTRIEGETVKYFAALVNADGLDGFTISGNGTINGNGFRYWRAFWLRREWNPQCTNKDEQRPRLLFISNSKNVQVSGVNLINSPFWTSHYYKCENLKIIGIRILAGTGNGSETRAPSSDGIDLDVCQNVLVRDSYIAVNDDGVCLKGGKGPIADQDPDNGANRNIIIENMTFDRCPALTLGSESVHSYNVLMRNCKVINASFVLRLKMRPDTPQKHEHILIENVTGSVRQFFAISPWTQFFDLKGHPQPKSSASHITLRNCDVRAEQMLNIQKSDNYSLSSITLQNLTVSTPKIGTFNLDFIKELKLSDITVNGKKVI